MKKRLLALLPLLLASCGSPTSSNSSTLDEKTIESSETEESSFAEIEGQYVYPSSLRKDKIQTLSKSLSSSLALPSLQDIENCMAKENGNIALSPASYILAVAGLSSVSNNFPNAAFGLNENAANDLKSLLKAWNFEYAYEREISVYDKEQDYCAFESVLVHQTAGSSYHFDAEKREEFLSSYVSTIESDLSSYHEDAEHFFHDLMGYSIPVPDPHLTQDGVLTYGGFKMKDYVPGGLSSSERLFRNKNVLSYCFGSVNWPLTVPYYKGTNYQAYNLKVNHTSLWIVLPDEGTSLSEVSLSDAYRDYMSNKTNVEAMGYVPYFHIQSENKDLTAELLSKLSGEEVFYDRLLDTSSPRNLRIQSVLQTSDYEFNKYGVSGEAITVIAMAGSAVPVEHNPVVLNVDRPFYCVSTKDDFPLFASKVVSIG